jgi:hypothetical protein
LHLRTCLYYTSAVTIKVIKEVERGTMDFTNRSAPAQQHHEADPVTAPGPGINIKRPVSTRQSDDGRWSRIGVVASLIAVVILIVAVIILVGSTNSTSNANNEASYIKTNKLQAVFLNTGQVYFGDINTLNNNYLVLSNIYYLQTSSSGSSSTTTSSNSNVTLVKLGCELHRPYDQMVINRSQVTFWENLQSDGQVAQAVQKYQQQNPTHSCVDQSTSAGTSTGNAAQGATSNSGSSSTGTSTSGQ